MVRCRAAAVACTRCTCVRWGLLACIVISPAPESACPTGATGAPPRLDGLDDGLDAAA